MASRRSPSWWENKTALGEMNLPASCCLEIGPLLSLLFVRVTLILNYRWFLTCTKIWFGISRVSIKTGGKCPCVSLCSDLYIVKKFPTVVVVDAGAEGMFWELPGLLWIAINACFLSSQPLCQRVLPSAARGRELSSMQSCKRHNPSTWPGGAGAGRAARGVAQLLPFPTVIVWNKSCGRNPAEVTLQVLWVLSAPGAGTHGNKIINEIISCSQCWHYPHLSFRAAFASINKTCIVHTLSCYCEDRTSNALFKISNSRVIAKKKKKQNI